MLTVKKDLHHDPVVKKSSYLLQFIITQVKLLTLTHLWKKISKVTIRTKLWKTC